jgi:hypothetical protein
MSGKPCVLGFSKQTRRRAGAARGCFGVKGPSGRPPAAGGWGVAEALQAVELDGGIDPLVEEGLELLVVAGLGAYLGEMLGVDGLGSTLAVAGVAQMVLMGPLVPGLGSLSRALNCASPLTQGVRKPAVGLVVGAVLLRGVSLATAVGGPADVVVHR